jgi:hypothetical protein
MNVKFLTILFICRIRMGEDFNLTDLQNMRESKGVGVGGQEDERREEVTVLLRKESPTTLYPLHYSII